MGGKAPLKAYAPRLLGNHEGKPGRAYRRYFDALAREFGPFESDIMRYEAGRAAVAMMNLDAATKVLADARRRRESSRGRKPSMREISALSRRQALQDRTCDERIDRLRELTKKKPMDLARTIRDRRREMHGEKSHGH